jgi:DNA-binding response OmpR family regulator
MPVALSNQPRPVLLLVDDDAQIRQLLSEGANQELITVNCPEFRA